MSTRTLPAIMEKRRLPSPALTPQALAWHGGKLWMGSRDLRRIYAIDVTTWTLHQEMEAPGIPWAAVSTGNDLGSLSVKGPKMIAICGDMLPEEAFRRQRKLPVLTLPAHTSAMMASIST